MFADGIKLQKSPRGLFLIVTPGPSFHEPLDCAEERSEEDTRTALRKRKISEGDIGKLFAEAEIVISGESADTE